ncbi:hypothetical protein RUM43_007291 [Polyplax serrata]|uniref:Uncharacterized protein n=1 Tax=Polyplax serrata TaxID=468196 RepID=A0AAN8PMG4_POLSC
MTINTTITIFSILRFLNFQAIFFIFLKGKGRYSLPRCVSLGKLNEKCRPGSIPQNITVSYPDGESVNLSHVYSILCPCQEGLYCSDQSGVCIDQMEELVFNTI